MDGSRYEGEYNNGVRQGQGKFLYSDGSVYDGKLHDLPLLNDGSNERKGQWEADKKEGKGTFTYPNGDVYTGDWKKGQRHGFGTYTFHASGIQVCTHSLLWAHRLPLPFLVVWRMEAR